jgi:hypothetical protein
MAPPPPTPAIGAYTEKWDQLLQTQRANPAAQASPPANLPDPKEMSKQSQLEYIAHSPIFQHRVDGRSFDAAIKSLNDITAELPEDVAKGFQKAAKLLMVTALPIGNARQAKRDISDDEIHASVLAAVGNKTPWEILLAAKDKREQLQAQVANDHPPAEGITSQ